MKRESRQAILRQASHQALSQQQDKQQLQKRFGAEGRSSKGQMQQQQPYEEGLRMQIRELYPKKIKRLGGQRSEPRLHTAQSREELSQSKNFEAGVPPDTQDVGMDNGNTSSKMPEPIDAYTDGQYDTGVADHKNLEEILAIPNDGRKRLNLHNNFQNVNQSRNPALTKLAAATAYSLGGKSWVSSRGMPATATTLFRTSSSAAHLHRQSQEVKNNPLQYTSALQLQRLQVASAANEFNRSFSSQKKKETRNTKETRDTNCQSTEGKSELYNSSLQKTLPKLRLEEGGKGGVLSEKRSRQVNGRPSVPLVQSKSQQVQQCASTKVQRMLQTSKLAQRGNNPPRIKGLEELGKLLLKETNDQTQGLWARTKSSGEVYTRPMTNQTGSDQQTRTIKPKSYQKIQQERKREFGPFDTSNEMMTLDEYNQQLTQSANDAPDNFSRGMIQSSALTFYNGNFHQSTSALPNLQHKIPLVGSGKPYNTNVTTAYHTNPSQPVNNFHSTVYGSTLDHSKPAQPTSLLQIYNDTGRQAQSSSALLKLQSRKGGPQPGQQATQNQRLLEKRYASQNRIQVDMLRAGPLAMQKGSPSRGIQLDRIESLQSSLKTPEEQVLEKKKINFANRKESLRYRGREEAQEDSQIQQVEMKRKESVKLGQKRTKDSKKRSPGQKNKDKKNEDQEQQPFVEQVQPQQAYREAQNIQSNYTEKHILHHSQQSKDRGSIDSVNTHQIFGTKGAAILNDYGPSEGEGYNQRNSGRIPPASEVPAGGSWSLRDQSSSYKGQQVPTVRDNRKDFDIQRTDRPDVLKQKQINQEQVNSHQQSLNPKEVMDDRTAHGEDQPLVNRGASSPKYLRKENRSGDKSPKKRSPKRMSPKRMQPKGDNQYKSPSPKKDKKTMDMIKSIPVKRKVSPIRKASMNVDAKVKRNLSAEIQAIKRLIEAGEIDNQPEQEDLNGMNIHSLSTILANDMSLDAIQALNQCIDNQQQRQNSIETGVSNLENADTREYLRRTNKLVKALLFTTQRLVLSQEDFHTELRLDSGQQVELVKDGTFYFKLNLVGQNPPIKLYFDYYDLSIAQVLRRNQLGNIIQVFVSQLNTKPKQNDCQIQQVSPSAIEINGAFNSGDRNKFENSEVYIAVQCMTEKAEDIVLKIRARAPADMSLNQLRQQKAETLQAAVEGAKLKNTMLDTFGNKFLHNIGKGEKARKLIDPQEIAIKTTNMSVFKEYIQKRITGMIDDEGKFVQYQQFCRNRQEEQLLKAGMNPRVRIDKQTNLFKDDSSVASQENDLSSQDGDTKKKSKKVAGFDFDHPQAFMQRQYDPITGKRPDNFVSKNREQVQYGQFENKKMNDQIKQQYKQLNEAAVRSKQQENELETYKRKFFLMIRQSILKELKEQLLDEANEVRKMRERIKRWIILCTVKRVIYKAKLTNFDSLLKKKQHEQYQLDCSFKIYKCFNRFINRKGTEKFVRYRQVCKSSITVLGLANIDSAKVQSRDIILDLVKENAEVEKTIKKIVRFGKIVELTQKQFRKRKELNKERIEKLAQTWLKIVSDKVQEKVKSNKKVSKNQVIMQRWMSFLDMIKKSGQIEQKAKELFEYQKQKYQLKNLVIIINETNKQYIYSTMLAQGSLADRYHQRIIAYQEQLMKRLGRIEELRAKLGIKIKAEKTTGSKKKATKTDSLDYSTIRKKLIMYGINDDLIRNNLEVGSTCGDICELNQKGEKDATEEFIASQIDTSMLEQEFNFPRSSHICFYWDPGEAIISETVDYAFAQYEKSLKDSAKQGKRGKSEGKRESPDMLDASAAGNGGGLGKATDSPDQPDYSANDATATLTNDDEEGVAQRK